MNGTGRAHGLEWCMDEKFLRCYSCSYVSLDVEC